MTGGSRSFTGSCEVLPRLARSTVPVTANRVLVVDDEEYIRDLVSSALRIAGFQTLVEPDGSRALAALAAQSPDLVVLDVGLPGIDGF